jgi:hypothetical protein
VVLSGGHTIGLSASTNPQVIITHCKISDDITWSVRPFTWKTGFQATNCDCQVLWVHLFERTLHNISGAGGDSLAPLQSVSLHCDMSVLPLKIPSARSCP